MPLVEMSTEVPILNVSNSGDTDPIATQLKDFAGNSIPGGSEVFVIESLGLPYTEGLFGRANKLIEEANANAQSDEKKPLMTYMKSKKYYTVADLTKLYVDRLGFPPQRIYPTAPVKREQDTAGGTQPGTYEGIDEGMRIGPDMNSLYPNYVIEKRTLVYTRGGRRSHRKDRSHRKQRRKQRRSRKQRR